MRRTRCPGGLKWQPTLTVTRGRLVVGAACAGDCSGNSPAMATAGSGVRTGILCTLVQWKLESGTNTPQQESTSRELAVDLGR